MMSSGYYKYQLTIDKFLDSGETVFPTREIVYTDKRRYTFKKFAESAKILANALKKIGVKKGDIVGVIDWDTDVYMHLYYAVPMIGAVLHTVNLRYPPELIIKTMLHAEDKWVIIRDDLIGLVEDIKNFNPNIRFIIYNDDKEKIKVDDKTIDFWDLLQGEPKYDPDEEGLKEDMMATLMYTSGTTGNPKGVWFTHRDLVLHAMAMGTISRAPPVELTTRDVVMSLVPMFHVHSWGFPYVALASGLKYVLPGVYNPATQLKLIANEGVTFSAMVPTILFMILAQPDIDDYKPYLKNWKVAIGGEALPEGLARKAREYGIKLYSGYGLTETCPVLTVAYHNSIVESFDEEKKFEIQLSAGVPIPGVKLRIVDEEGKDVPRGKIGEIVVRAPWTTREYYKDPEKTAQLWRGGWLHTGDLGYIDEYGYLHLVDREKDAIKSGGEFIPSLLLETVISLHPSVAEVAVVGIRHEKWGERPVAFIVPNGQFDEVEMRKFLMKKVEEGKIQKWWIPDRFFVVEDIPKTSTMKADKKLLREMASKELQKQK
ncbi:medium-chain-fatty-acid-CoA ligase [Sulfolobus acidocaldarius N8]|nr:medium-chain-fatty-acid-CoA ligase [Sulfolobus acidocaldarius N8]AGE74431.1 medium-chain-fatty-acid-CoA ligase [Sulfolobus acidocaldarius Ron12/I]WCM33885.1 long-chain-fatty-acid--CoA ligase [Sulfolobus acidocaldarius DSM 639]